MPGFGRAEFFFISAMMLLIVIVCGFAVYAFFKTYRKEMLEKENRLAKERAEAEKAAE